MQIRADGVVEATTLLAVLAVVSEAVQDTTKRHCIVVENGSSHVVLEASELEGRGRRKGAFQKNIANQATFAGMSFEREDACANQLLAVSPTVASAQELVSATHRENRDAACHEVSEASAASCEI
jgi:5-deoxy-D-glucuronate isomerase